MPPLYEVFALLDSEERRRRLIQPSSSSVSSVDQMALAAHSGPRSSTGKIICHHCGAVGHVKARCFKLHPELKPRHTPKSTPRTATIADTIGSSAISSTPDWHQLQAQISQLQDQLGSMSTHTLGPSTSTATLATGTHAYSHLVSRFWGP